MNALIDKLSSYNLFNNLLPGILFVVLSSKFTKYNFLLEDVIIGVFIYYFIGSIVSRIGSIVVEPILKLIKFIKFAPYEKFVEASKVDSKIEILSEQNNMFRSFISTFFMLFVLKCYELLEAKLSLGDWNITILIVLLIILYLFSYRKQTTYMTKRIGNNLKGDG